MSVGSLEMRRAERITQERSTLARRALRHGRRRWIGWAGVGVGVLVLLGVALSPLQPFGLRAQLTSGSESSDPADPAGPEDGAEGEANDGAGEPAGASALPEDPAGAAEEVCEERLARFVEPDNPFNARVLAAFPTTAGEAVTEHEMRRGSGFESPMRGRPPTQFASLCFFEADAFGIPYVPGPDASLPTGVHTRLMEVVLPDGEAFLLASGGNPDVEVVPFSEAGSR